jgi:hypothetical protein
MHAMDDNKIIVLFTSNIHLLGYSLVQSEIIASLVAESLHNSLKPMWASMVTQKDMVINLSVSY